MNVDIALLSDKGQPRYMVSQLMGVPARCLRRSLKSVWCISTEEDDRFVQLVRSPVAM